MFVRLFPVTYLLLNGVIYLLLAWIFIDQPRNWFANLGITLQDETGYTELKTMYIGLMGSLGLYFITAAELKPWRTPALGLALISYTALALVRAYGLYIEGLGNDFMGQLLLAEIVSALLAIIALYCQQRAARRTLHPIPAMDH